MTIHGREVTFKKTVGAACAIEKLFDAAGGAEAFFGGSYANQQTNAAAFMEELSKGAEEAAFWEARNRGEQYQLKLLTASEALTLGNDEFNALCAEALAVWRADLPQVKAEEGKKTENPLS